jgi:hypothetical protein
MSFHLSEQQVSAVIAGEINPRAADHLAGCAACRQEVERFENALGHFRGSVRDWSESRFSGSVAVQPRRHLWPALAYAWAFALIVLLSVVGYRFSHGTAAAPSALESDVVLLDRVKADVSRSAPPRMETLLGLTSAETVQR